MATETLARVHYPSSDGKPMAETDTHMRWMATIKARLQRRFAGKKVYVSANLLVYYVKGKPELCFSPDVFVVKNCSPKERRIFKIWEEGKVPNWDMEITSVSTRREDLGSKKALNAKLGIKEYFLFDPLEEWLEPPLQGYRLRRGQYERIEPEPDGSVFSKELGIFFCFQGSDLQMKDAVTEDFVLSGEEIAEAAEQMAQEERRRAREAERRLAEANAELQRLKKELGRRNNGKPNGKA